MAKKLDPSYWGNPPQTPTRNTSHVQPEQPMQPTQPTQPQAAQHQSWAGGQTNANFSQPPYGQQPTQPYPQASQSASTQANYPQTPSKKHRGCLIAAIIAVIIVILLGVAGCVACTSLMSSNVTYHSSQEYLPLQPNTPETQDDVEASLNNEFFRNAFDLSGSTPDAPLTTNELNDIQSSYFANNTKQPNDEGLYSDGVYFIGNDIPAGSYWFTGDDNALSFFFILEPTGENGSYKVAHINNYYGHNLMEVGEGEVLVLVNDGTMQPLDSFSKSFSAPYQSGTYRVGVDIPAGTYQLQLGGADDYSACYVMSDLSFSTDSYLYEAHYIEGDSPDEVTLDEGTYVELYNMSMTPVVM